MERRWDKSKPPRGPFALNRDCPQAQGLVAWFPMGGPSGKGQAFDLAGKYHLSGTVSGATLGIDGNPVQTFNGSSDFLIQSSASPVSGVPLTLSSWGRADSASLVGSMLSVDAGQSSGGSNVFHRLVVVGSASPKQVRANSGASGSLESQATYNAAWTAGQWFHVVGVFNTSADRSVYYNGSFGANDTTLISTGTPTKVQYGRHSVVGSEQYWNGSLGEAGVWNVALPAHIIARLYDPGTRFELWYPLRSRKWFTQGAAAYTLTAAQASFSLTGQSAGLIAARKLVAAQASFSLTGNAAGLLFGRKIAAAQASFALTGIDASLTYSPSGAYTLTAASASFSLTGNAAGLVVARKLTSDHASFALTGQSAGLTYARGIAAGTGVFTLTGIDAALSTTGTVTQTARAVGAGRSRRRRPYVVEIDGHDFVVNSEEEAAALLENAKEEAEQVARQAIERAAKVKVRPVRKVIADARKSLALPDIKAPGLEDYAAQITQHIEELYQDALRTIEIAALIAKREREDEDDEDILLLMA